MSDPQTWIGTGILCLLLTAVGIYLLRGEVVPEEPKKIAREREKRELVESLARDREKFGDVLANVPGAGFLDLGISLYKGAIFMEGHYRDIDVHTVAEVISGGQVQITTRPTLTRMALLAPIPGSALLPGLALAKSKTNDSRECEIIVTSLSWQHSSRIKPADVGRATAIANRINTFANSLVVAEERSSLAASQTINLEKASDGLSVELTKLNDLLKSGVLSEDEFKAAKAKILGA